MIKPLIPFLVLLLVGLAVIIFVPWFSTALPQAMDLTY
jgi:TRAP-type C4-dicarboxylate transport system permease large subunit